MKKPILAASAVFFALFSFAQQPASAAKKNQDTQDKIRKKDIALADIWTGQKFKGESVSDVSSMKDGLHYTSLENAGSGDVLIKFSYTTGEAVDTILYTASLLSAQSPTPITIESYSFSSDETKLLIATGTEPIYRHSSRSLYYIYEIKTRKLTLLTEDKVSLAEFSPAGDKVAYMQDNNLFVANYSSVETKADGIVQLTFNGKKNDIINGAADWVYEEEFAFDKAFFWSPDGSKLAYYQFDERSVKEFAMPVYNGMLYPDLNTFKYPKAGEENSAVAILVFDIKKSKTTNIELGVPVNQYIPRVKWTKDSGILSIQRMNRHQNKLELLLADVEKGNTKTVLTEISDTYIDVSDDLTFLDDKQQFLWTSERSGFKHVYLYDINGNLVRQVTKGDWDITELTGIDESTQTLFYLSAEDSPLQRHLYSIKSDGSDKKKLTTRKGFNEPMFSRGMKYFINNHSAINSPSYITVNDASGKEIRVAKDNAALRRVLSEYTISQPAFFSFATPDSVVLNGWMIKPSSFDSTKKYPVFIYVYGGPGSQTVQDKWAGGNYLWFQHLAQKGYVVVSVDNRGTGARGAKFKKCTYKQLGKLETIDQGSVAKYLASLSYIDGKRIGIFGWSYGGYMSSLCITKNADLFRMAIAVAPVTNWRFYDTIYTERYMQTPQENASGYDDNSPINYVDKLKGSFLLVHGSADDNVHFQNSVEMVNALVNANKQFDFYMYPDKNHSIHGGNARLHLYSKMTNFIMANL